jgi:hypothetical protein
VFRRDDSGALRRDGAIGDDAAVHLWTPEDVPVAARGFIAEPSTMAFTTSVLTSWGNIWGGSAATCSGTPRRKTGDPNFLDGICVSMAEATSRHVTTPGVESAYVALHDGTGGTFGYCGVDSTADDTMIPLATCNATLTNHGVFARRRGASGGFTLGIRNGSDILTAIADGLVASGTRYAVAFDLLGTAYRIAVASPAGLVVVSGTVGGAPSSTNPTGVLRLGTRSPSPNEYYTGRINSWGFFKQAKAPEFAAYLYRKMA